MIGKTSRNCSDSGYFGLESAQTSKTVSKLFQERQMPFSNKSNYWLFRKKSGDRTVLRPFMETAPGFPLTYESGNSNIVKTVQHAFVIISFLIIVLSILKHHTVWRVQKYRACKCIYAWRSEAWRSDAWRSGAWRSGTSPCHLAAVYEFQLPVLVR